MGVCLARLWGPVTATKSYVRTRFENPLHRTCLPPQDEEPFYAESHTCNLNSTYFGQTRRTYCSTRTVGILQRPPTPSSGPNATTRPTAESAEMALVRSFILAVVLIHNAHAMAGSAAQWKSYLAFNADIGWRGYATVIDPQTAVPNLPGVEYNHFCMPQMTTDPLPWCALRRA